MISAIIAMLLQGGAAVTAPPPPSSTCDAPVYMVVEGLTLDRDRMIAYARAIAASEIYEKLGGYYVTIPRPVAVFEGEAPPNYVNLTVRFPCLENAKAFWNSEVYQNEILPLRQNPSAGDYTVTVYAEAPLRSDMVGKVGDNRFTHDFDNSGVPQVSGAEQ